MVGALVEQCVQKRGIIQYSWEVRRRADGQCTVGSLRHYSAAPSKTSPKSNCNADWFLIICGNTWISKSVNFICIFYTGGKQWQTIPKNLPRMQRTKAIPVAWLNSGLCPDWPKGWIPIILLIIIIIIIIILHCLYQINLLPFGSKSSSSRFQSKIITRHAMHV